MARQGHAREARRHDDHRRELAGRDRGSAGEVTAILEITATSPSAKRILDQLGTADRRKNEFLATIAHELRSTLTPVHNGMQRGRRNAALLNRVTIGYWVFDGRDELVEAPWFAGAVRWFEAIP